MTKKGFFILVITMLFLESIAHFSGFGRWIYERDVWFIYPILQGSIIGFLVVFIEKKLKKNDE